MKDKHVAAGLAGGACKQGKMLEGDVKEKHVEAGLAGGACKQGKMLEGDEKDKHIAAGVARGAPKRGKMEPGEKLKAHVKALRDGKMAARLKMLHELTIAKGGQWRLVAAAAGKPGRPYIHHKTVKFGDELPYHSSYRWCFYDGRDTLTAKIVKKMLKK
jgi:hypothetical protein